MSPHALLSCAVCRQLLALVTAEVNCLFISCCLASMIIANGQKGFSDVSTAGKSISLHRLPCTIRTKVLIGSRNMMRDCVRIDAHMF